MKIKEYLMQAYRIDQRINSRLEQIASLHDLAIKATVTYSDMPRNPNKVSSVRLHGGTFVILFGCDVAA